MQPTKMFEMLLAHFGPQRWWPGDSPFEVMVGAILTQQTSWANVERAIANLRAAGALSPGDIAAMEPGKLESLIRPSGFYRQKARYLNALCRHILGAYGGDPDAMLSVPLEVLRPELLALPGIGPETADSLLLYAGGKPAFVVDAYTIRICQRTGVFGSPKYDVVKKFFEDSLPRDVGLYNEFHALFVKLGKDMCRPGKPLCGECPLRESCLYARTGTGA
ncbi:MAG: endonuclease III domain-containing protein [Thermoplasmata archaeon]